MPAAVDLSFERFLRRPLPSPPSKEANKPEASRHHLMSRADDGETEVDELRDVPLLASCSSHTLQNRQATRRNDLLVHRSLDDDYDDMDISSDTEPVPQTPTSTASDGDSLSAPSMRGEHDDEDHDIKMDYGDADYDSASSEDRPLAPLRMQEQPSIATIEDEERPSESGGSSSRPRSPYASRSQTHRPKYRPYRDQHSAVPMPCLIDSCKHTSWMPKEREKHMDTHFHKRWQCGNCKKWYSTSYTLKRHSDSTHVPEACKGAYEAGQYVNMPPYWTIPEFVHRVRMPEESDYLYPVLVRVFQEREQLLAKGMLNKRPLPEEIRSTSGVPKKRARKARPECKAPRIEQTALPAPSDHPSIMFGASRPSRSPTPATAPSDHTSGTLSHVGESNPGPEPDVSLPDTKPIALDTSEPGNTRQLESDGDSIKTVIIHSHTPTEVKQELGARELCFQHWVVEHPDGIVNEFNKYWEEAGLEEKQAYEILSKLREDRRN